MKIAQRPPQLNRNPKWTTVLRRLFNRRNSPFASSLPSIPCRDRKNPYIRLCDFPALPPPTDTLGGGISNHADNLRGAFLAGAQPKSAHPQTPPHYPREMQTLGKRVCTPGCQACGNMPCRSVGTRYRESVAKGRDGQFRAIAVAQPSDLTGVDQDRYRSRVMPDPLLASQQAPPRGPRGPVMSYRWPTHSWPPLRRSVLKCRTRPTTDLGRDLVTACCASPARLRSDRASLSQLRASVGLMWAVPTTLALVG